MPTVPDPVLHKIRCVHCKSWLSCGPITLLPNGGSVCGRCQTLREGPRDQYRHFAFEALASYFSFPCKYWERNCPEIFPFRKVLEHENECSYRSACGTFFLHPSVAFKPKRHLDIGAAIRLEVIPDEILEYLRCGCCAGYLSCRPIFVCRDGTSICHRCSTQVYPNAEFLRDFSFEVLAEMMIFPCIYRYRGCTQYFKFGDHSRQHELDCSYGRPYIKSSHGSSVQRQESALKGQKERGVIKTHSGHIYATLTPNAPVFGRPSNRQDNGLFLNEFQKHRENLTALWGKQPDDEPQAFKHVEPDYPSSSNGKYPDRLNGGSGSPVDGTPRLSQQSKNSSVNDNMGYENGFINELKHVQSMRQGTNAARSPRIDDNGYYSKEKESKRKEYAVYS